MHASRGRPALFLLLLIFLPSRAVGDDWPAAQVANAFSANGQYFVRITPGESVGDTVGFAGAPKGVYARAEFYARQADRSYALIADVALENPVAPVDALVSIAGHLITFDNWHNIGYGRVVAIYGPHGKLIAAYDLEQLYPPDRLSRLPMSVSSRWWRCSARGYVDPGKETAVFVTERLGGTFVFELATGKFDYRPGKAECQ